MNFPTGSIPCLAKLALLTLLCWPADPAAAQPTKVQTDAIRKSCRSDYQSYCASVPTGGPAALQCLQQHLADLSPNCQGAVSAVNQGGKAPSTDAAAPATTPPAPSVPHMTMRQEAALMRHACGDDFHNYCSNVRLGGGRGVACLVENESRLSPSCKDALAEARANQ